MADREKVIAMLKCIANLETVYVADCKRRECPYAGIECTRAVAADALDLLREQEAHVMTAEEALTRRIGYLETRINGHAYRGGYVLVQTLEIMMGDSWKWELVRTINSAVYFYQDQYNRDFRLWSERPNDKKRKAVKWNG